MITVYMNSPNHEAFRQFLSQEPLVTEAHRISGEGCYWLRAEVASHDELNTLLERILRYGNYRINLSIGKVK